MFFKKKEDLDILPPPPPFPDINEAKLEKISSKVDKFIDKESKSENNLSTEIHHLEKGIIDAAKKLEKKIQKSLLHPSKEEPSSTHASMKASSKENILDDFVPRGDFIEVDLLQKESAGSSNNKDYIGTKSEITSEKNISRQESVYKEKHLKDILPQGDFIEIDKAKLQKDYCSSSNKGIEEIIPLGDFIEIDERKIPSYEIKKPKEIHAAEYEIKKAIEDLKIKKMPEKELPEKGIKKSIFSIFKKKQVKQESLTGIKSKVSESMDSSALPEPPSLEQTADLVSHIHDKIHEIRTFLMDLKLKEAKQAYIKIIQVYNTLSYQDQAKVYEDIKDIYEERKIAESLNLKFS